MLTKLCHGQILDLLAKHDLKIDVWFWEITIIELTNIMKLVVVETLKIIVKITHYNN